MRGAGEGRRRLASGRGEGQGPAGRPRARRRGAGLVAALVALAGLASPSPAALSRGRTRRVAPAPASGLAEAARGSTPRASGLASPGPAAPGPDAAGFAALGPGPVGEPPEVSVLLEVRQLEGGELALRLEASRPVAGFAFPTEAVGGRRGWAVEGGADEPAAWSWHRWGPQDALLSTRGPAAEVRLRVPGFSAQAVGDAPAGAGDDPTGDPALEGGPPAADARHPSWPSAGGLLVDVEVLEVHPLVVDGPGRVRVAAGDVPYRYRLRAAPGHRAYVAGEEGGEHVEVGPDPDPLLFTPYAFFSPRAPARVGRARFFLDPDLPGWLRDATLALAPGVLDDHQALAGQALPAEPLVLCDWDPEGAPDALDVEAASSGALLEVRAAGSGWGWEDDDSLVTWTWTLAHHAFHLWNHQAQDLEDLARDEWLGEGLAELAALDSLRARALLTPDQRRVWVQEMSNRCLRVAGGEALVRVPPDAAQDCGVAALAWLEARARRAGHALGEVVALALARGRARGGRYGAQDLVAAASLVLPAAPDLGSPAATPGSIDEADLERPPPAGPSLASWVDLGLGEAPGAALAERWRSAGVEARVAPMAEAVEGGDELVDLAILELSACDCPVPPTWGYGEQGVEVDPTPGCEPFEAGAVLVSVEGASLLHDPGEAVARILAARAEGRAPRLDGAAAPAAALTSCQEPGLVGVRLPPE